MLKWWHYIVYENWAFILKGYKNRRYDQLTLDCKEIQPVHPKGDQSSVFFGRTDAEAETPVLWPPHVKSWLIGKDPDAGRDWGWEEKGTTEDEMAGWHHRLDGRESEWTPGVGDGQGGLACCNSWGRRVGHDWVNWTEQQIATVWKQLNLVKNRKCFYRFLYVSYSIVIWTWKLLSNCSSDDEPNILTSKHHKILNAHSTLGNIAVYGGEMLTFNMHLLRSGFLCSSVCAKQPVYIFQIFLTFLLCYFNH